MEDSLNKLCAVYGECLVHETLIAAASHSVVKHVAKFSLYRRVYVAVRLHNSTVVFSLAFMFELLARQLCCQNFPPNLFHYFVLPFSLHFLHIYQNFQIQLGCLNVQVCFS